MTVVEQTAPVRPQKSMLDFLFGRPLSSEEDRVERIGPAAGVPVFGLDALSSAAYGPEAALTILMPLGIAGLAYIVRINGVGAISTGLALCIILVAKFVEGAWITILLIPGLILLMSGVRRHYDYIRRETANRAPANLAGISSPIVVVPMERWSRIAEKALRFAYAISRDIWVVHITSEDEQPAKEADLKSVWGEYIEKPAIRAGLKPPELVVLHSPYRLVVPLFTNTFWNSNAKNPDRQIAVLVPELVERRWLYYLLHRQRATALKLILYRKGDRRTIAINVPWYLSA